MPGVCIHPGRLRLFKNRKVLTISFPTVPQAPKSAIPSALWLKLMFEKHFQKNLSIFENVIYFNIMLFKHQIEPQGARNGRFGCLGHRWKGNCQNFPVFRQVKPSRVDAHIRHDESKKCNYIKLLIFHARTNQVFVHENLIALD